MTTEYRALSFALTALALTASPHPAAVAAEPVLPDRAALLAFAQEPLSFESFVFTGPAFPTCDFDRPEHVAKLIGPYTLHNTFYNGAGKVVTEPAKQPGRYAAVVEIRRSGRVSRRFFTLYHLASKNIIGLGVSGAALTLPRGTGIDSAVPLEQGQDIDELATRTLSTALKKDPAVAALLAGMHDLSRLREAGKATADDRASHRERQWWVDFKRRYYGFDKLYPDRFVGPRPVEGKPAPVVREGTLAEAGMKPDAVATIDAAAEAWVNENGNGFGLCVVRRGRIVVNKGYGRSQGKPVTADTPAALASTTKFLNALLLLEFVDRGLIRLEDPVEKYVPAMRGVKVSRSMKVRDLYLHTAGLAPGLGAELRPDLEEWLADQYPALEVGVRHQYQNTGHALASKVMEMMTGEALPELYRNHLFAPLGCTHTRADFSAYGSWGTPIELARIGQMALNGGSYGDRRFFGPETFAQMLPVPGKDRIGDDKTVRWGLGIKQLDLDGLSDKAFGHPGGSGSFLLIDPARDLVIGHARMTEGPSFENFLKQKARMIAAIVAAIDDKPR